MVIKASSSSDSQTLPQDYDVFLSFRGANTRKTFTGHLLAALEQCGFRTFRDDTKLRRGEEIEPELFNAIYQSSLSIVVFSKNYASSRWCLDELVHIMESRRKWQQIVLPIFYDVDPSTVRSQSGHYAEAFAEHKKHFKLEQLEKWRQALSDAANLSGWDLQDVTNGHEAKFIKGIVKDVANKLNHTSLSVADHPVGIESRVRKLDMGREIVRQESPREPGERSRLWHYKDVLDVLRYNLGTKVVECLSLDLIEASEGLVNTKAFAKMNRLRLLRLYNVQLSGSFKYLSRRLIELRWVGCPLKYFPATMYIDNLVLLDLSNSSSLKHVWQETKVLNKLKFFYLDYCNSLTKTPVFTGVTSLEKLSLVGCKALVEVDKSIGYLKNLEFLNLKDCRNLEKLPQSIFTIKSLKSFDLSGCSKLVKLVGAEEESPRKWWNSLYSSLLHRLLRIKTPDSAGLTLASIRALSWIKRLYLVDCNISYVPSEIGSLISLDFLDLSGNTFSCLPSTICNLAQLRGLSLRKCTLLQSIPMLPENLNLLNAHDCKSLESIPIRATGKVQGMNLSYCPKLLYRNFANDFRADLLCSEELRRLDIFNVVVGGCEVPDWCEYRSTGSFLSLVVPQRPGLHQEMLGLMLCAVFDFRRERHADARFDGLVDLDIHNKTRGIMRNFNVHNKTTGSLCRDEWNEWNRAIPITECEGQVWLVYFSNRWSDVEFEGGDELELSIASDIYRVKELGASPVSLSHVGVNDH